MSKVLFLGCLLGVSVANAAAPAVKDYDVQWQSNIPQVPLNTPAVLTLLVTPKSPWLLKKDPPFSFVIKSTPELKIEKSSFNNKDLSVATYESLNLNTSVSAAAADSYTLTGELSFFLCTPEICQRHKETLTLKIVAK